MFSRGVALAVVCQLVVIAGIAGADDKTGKQKRADELFQEGRALLQQGDQNAAPACVKFTEAIRLDPEAPGTLLNLGLCNEKLKKYKTALYWFRKAQARAAETSLPEYEQAAKDHTIDLKQNKVATIRIAFAGAQPEGTRVKIDGEEVAPADYLAVEVDPGDHVLTAGAPGHKNFEQQFTVADRGGQTMMIELVEGDNVIIVDRGAGRRKAAIITAAGGGTLLVASLVVSLVAQSHYKDCADNGKLKLVDGAYCKDTPEEARDYANDQKNVAKYWGTGLFIAGAATVSVAAVLYFTAPEKERIDRTVFLPTIGPNDIGFAVGGHF